MTRVALISIALLSPFFFPVPFTLILGFAAGLIFPPLVLLVGILIDTLFYVPSTGLPFGILFGFCGFVVTFFVRRIVQTRIMS
jgi:hypothetical protein